MTRTGRKKKKNLNDTLTCKRVQKIGKLTKKEYLTNGKYSNRSNQKKIYSKRKYTTFTIIKSPK